MMEYGPLIPRYPEENNRKENNLSEFITPFPRENNVSGFSTYHNRKEKEFFEKAIRSEIYSLLVEPLKYLNSGKIFRREISENSYLDFLKGQSDRLDAQAKRYLSILGKSPSFEAVLGMNRLIDSGVWDYLRAREKRVGEDAGFWLAAEGAQKAGELFEEAERMYDLARKALGVFGQLESVAWAQFDPFNSELARDKVSEILASHEELIVAIIKSRREGFRPSDGDHEDVLSVPLVIEALNVSDDLRGIAIAASKKRYLEGIVGGASHDDLDLVFLGWTPEQRDALWASEIQIYLHNGYRYLKAFPDGLLRYAQWRLGEEVKRIGQATNERDLNFAVSLANQQEAVRGWFDKVADYAGESAARRYMEKMCLNDGNDIRILDWHDTLVWTQNIDKLSQTEIRSILTTLDEPGDNSEFVNLLARYDREQDPFSDKPVISIRELKKRVLAIEANIDIRSIPPAILEVLDAPGFNLSALRSMLQKAEFGDLLSKKLDEKQPFEPALRILTVRPIENLVAEGLGSKKRGLKGTASSTKKLFYALGHLVKDRIIDGRKMAVDDLLNSVPEDLTPEVLNLLQKFKVDVGPVMVAQIHAKSDPEGWVCGNYTDSCMPFGDRKNDDYMFNPSTQYFTVKCNGRIVAQSVVVSGYDERTGEDVIILDNIEVANRYRNLDSLLARTYEVFWSDYTDKPVKIGAGFSELIPPSCKLVENTYRPKTSLLYSDAKGKEIYNLPKIGKNRSVGETMVEGISEGDILLIAKMEEEAYPESMVQGKEYIEDILKRSRETSLEYGATSFIFRKDGEVAGYVLAIPEESEIKKGETVLHVYDFVVAPKSRNSGIALQMIKHMLNLAKTTGLAIEAESRDRTFGKHLASELVRKKFRELGFNLTRHEILADYLGGEDFSFIRIEKLQQEDRDENGVLAAVAL